MWKNKKMVQEFERIYYEINMNIDATDFYIRLMKMQGTFLLEHSDVCAKTRIVGLAVQSFCNHPPYFQLIRIKQRF